MALEDLKEDDIKSLEKLPKLKSIVESCRTCVDCDNPQLEWASINLGTFLCSQCAGVHRSLGTHISKVRSLYLDNTIWTDDQITQMKNNEEFNQEWEYHVLPKYIKPRAHSPRNLREQYIKTKYQYIIVKQDANNNNNDNHNNINEFKIWSPFSKEHNENNPPLPPVYDEVNNEDVVKKEGQGMVQFNGVLEIFVKSGKDMPRADVGGEVAGRHWGGTCDPYLLFDSGSQQVKTKVIKDTYNPVWNERIQLSVKEDVPVKIQLFDWDMGEFNDDDYLGYTELDILSEVMNKKGEVEITKKN